MCPVGLFELRPELLQLYILEFNLLLFDRHILQALLKFGLQVLFSNRSSFLEGFELLGQLFDHF